MASRVSNATTFYARDGWRFSRLPNGAVWMQNDRDEGGVEFDAATWASVVAAVSAGGAAAHGAALDFHQGPPPRETREAS